MKTYLIAIGILVTLALWMASSVFSDKSPVAQAEVSEKQPIKVRVQALAAQNKQINVELRGRTEAKRIVNITAETSGKLIKTPIEKGQQVKKGDLLCQLAEEDRTAQLARAKASREKSEIDYEGNLKLFKDGMISSSVLAASKAQLEADKAALKLAEVNVANLQMTAPFDAYVEDRPAQVGAMMERGAICARLLDESLMLATGQISEKQIHLIQVGQQASVELSDGRTLDGKITFIARTADSITRTYIVEVELEKGKEVVRAGVTARVTIPIAQVKAHHFSPVVLTLNEEEHLAVRIVNESDIVELIPIKVVEEDVGGIWVTGLEDKVRLITVGQELVTQGQQVEAVAASH